MTETTEMATVQGMMVEEHAHPGSLEYTKVAIVLAVVTAVEVGLFYMDLAKGLLIPSLFVLSAVKFSLVVMFFMHLKFDSRLFSWLFIGGLALALAAFSAVLAMFKFFVV